MMNVCIGEQFFKVTVKERAERESYMSKKLFLEAMIKFFLGVVLVGTLIFLPAGSFSYWKGWLFMGVLFLPMFLAGLIMMIKNPELLKRRLKAKEKEMEQEKIIKLSGLMFIAGFVVSGLNQRFSWLIMPNYITVIGTVLFLISYLLYAEILRENTYLSRTIEVTKEQKVVDKGLYGMVRHPMYSTTLVLFLSIPLILGCIQVVVIFLLYPFLIVKRLKEEEVFLEKNLPGYKEYRKKVKYRLIPFLW